MERCYVPHCGDIPLVVTINGHDLILVASSPDTFEGSSLLLGEKPSLSVPEPLPHHNHSAALDPEGLESAALKASMEEDSDPSRSLKSPLPKGEGVGTTVEVEARTQRRIQDIEVREYDLEALDLATRYNISNEMPELTIVGGDDGVPSVNTYEVFEKDRFLEMTRMEQFAKQLAAQSGSGVVFIPAAISLDQLLDELQAQLPWCH